MNLYKFETPVGDHYVNLDNVTHFVVESDVVRIWFDNFYFKEDSLELAKTPELLERLGIETKVGSKNEPNVEPKVEPPIQQKKIKGQFKKTKIN